LTSAAELPPGDVRIVQKKVILSAFASALFLPSRLTALPTSVLRFLPASATGDIVVLIVVVVVVVIVVEVDVVVVLVVIVVIEVVLFAVVVVL
jgi:hypothetical protein